MRSRREAADNRLDTVADAATTSGFNEAAARSRG